MTTDKTPTEALAQLRHLYAQLKSQDGMSRTDRLHACAHSASTAW